MDNVCLRDGTAVPIGLIAFRWARSGTRLAPCGRMSSIRVATVQQLPPGKGRIMEVEGRHVTVFNRDGRFYATCTRSPRRSTPAHVDTSYGGSPGIAFEVWAEDSPARLDDDSRCRVRIDGDDVFLVVG